MFTTPGIPQLDGCAERRLPILEGAERAARVSAASLFGDMKMLNSNDTIWTEAMD